jgi:hypothetical protein
MRIVLGFLSGVVGMLAGWFSLAFLVIALTGPDRDGGVTMGAFFNIGPLGALIGFGVGVWLFVKFGLVAHGAAFTAAPPSEPASASSPAPSPAVYGRSGHSSNFPFLCGHRFGDRRRSGVVWYEFIRSPYLTHGYMTLALQFRLPADMAAPAEAQDVQIVLDEEVHRWPAYLNEAGWRGHQGNRAVILASVR